MKKKRNTKKRRQIQLCTMFLSFVLVSIFVFTISAGVINANSDLNITTYKYYTTVYVERGDSLWSIANEHMTKEYKDADQYIAEVKQINNLKGSKLNQGSYICVPYYSTEHK